VICSKDEPKQMNLIQSLKTELHKYGYLPYHREALHIGRIKGELLYNSSESTKYPCGKIKMGWCYPTILKNRFKFD
jgi:hypothetical protein